MISGTDPSVEAVGVGVSGRTLERDLNILIDGGADVSDNAGHAPIACVSARCCSEPCPLVVHESPEIRTLPMLGGVISV